MILIFKNKSATIKENIRNLIKGYLTFRGGNIMYLKVENIKKYYGQGENKIEVLRGIDCGVEKGEMCVMLGPSGSGKSTLMNIIGCLDTPTKGSYYLNNEDVSTLSDKRLSQIRNNQIGFIFQGYNLIPNLDALENVELPLMYRGLDRDKRRKISLEALERVGMGHRIHHRPSQLSGGQQQRVAIARAIASCPPLILADEPTGNLDSVSGSEVIKIIHQLNNDGQTVILITHYMDEAAQADRVVVMDKGKVIMEGIPRDIF